MFKQAFKNIDDLLWKEAGCTTELDYTEQTSWLHFLKCLDALEQDKPDPAETKIVESVISLQGETQRVAAHDEGKLAALEALKTFLLNQAFSGALTSKPDKSVA